MIGHRKHARSFTRPAVVLLALPAFAVPGLAEELPPARQLVAEVLQELGPEHRQREYVLTWNELAAAQACLGDFAAARRTLLPYENNLMILSGYYQCAAIELERTGSTTTLPDAIWRDEPDWAHWTLAEAYIRRGEMEKAWHHLRQIPPRVGTPLYAFAHELVPLLLERRQREAARELLHRWVECLATASSWFHYRHASPPEPLVRALVELGDREKAQALCAHWQQVLQARPDVEEDGEYLALSWVSLASCRDATGERAAAEHALKQAQTWLEKAYATAFNAENRLDYQDYAGAYAALGARQAAILDARAAASSYAKADELARSAVLREGQVEEGFSVLRTIAVEQYRGGDVERARQTIERIVAPRHRARAWQEILRHTLQQRDEERARSAARAAATLLDQEGFEPDMASELALVAADVGRAGEKERSRRLFQRALALSEKATPPRSHHMLIGKAQIQAELLPEAYATARAISEPQERWYVLAALARAAAGQETERRPLR